MNIIVRYMSALVLAVLVSTSASAQGIDESIVLRDLDLNINLSTSDILLADNSTTLNSYKSIVPNIPDSAFQKPGITKNDIHQYLGLASLAMGGLAAISAPDEYDPDLLNSVHYKAAKLSWQLGAAAVATGLYAHWDDFHLRDGLLDRDNLHALLGLAGTLGYYIAVSSAVDQYNKQGYPSEDHASAGMFGGAAMVLAIGFTW